MRKLKRWAMSADKKTGLGLCPVCGRALLSSKKKDTRACLTCGLCLSCGMVVTPDGDGRGPCAFCDFAARAFRPFGPDGDGGGGLGKILNFGQGGFHD
jgi:hypothetical protein